MLRFTLRQLEYLVAVGDCGSVTIAAERQRAAAAQRDQDARIADLEQRLGTQGGVWELFRWSAERILRRV